MSDEKDARIAELEDERNDLARQLGEEIGRNQRARDAATCEDASMARSIRELEVLTIEAARQLRDRMLLSKLNFDYDLKVALALLDRQLSDLDRMRAARLAVRPDGVPAKK